MIAESLSNDMIQSVCPTEDEIRAFLQGKLSEESGDQIQGHFSQCRVCLEKSDQLESADDSLMRHLRIAPAASGRSLEDGLSDCDGRNDLIQNDRLWDQQRNALYQIPQLDVSSEDTTGENLKVEDADAPDQNPMSVYHYQLQELLGRGGMGVVYRSWHPQLHRPVAVKLLSIARASDTQSIARFQREMRAAGGLDHPGIVRALDAGEWRGTNFLVMEYVEGIDLSRLIRVSGPLRQADAAAIIVQLAEAIQSAHDNQVIHRDIKPSNVMLTREGAVKVLDFGLALMDPAAGGMVAGGATSTGRLLGTLDYLSPEQARGDQSVDHRADVYAMGATLFKLLTGQPPHGTSRGRSVLEHLQNLSTAQPRDITSLRQDLAPEFCDALTRMISQDVEARPHSATEVANLLRPFVSEARLSDLALQALANQTPDDKPTLSTDLVWKSLHAPNPDRDRGRISRWLLATGILILAIFGGITLWLNTGEGTIQVESNVDDITLQLIEDDAVSDEISVRPGTQSSSVRVGKYELRISGGTDDIRLSTDQVSLLRGGEQIVRITKNATLPDKSQVDVENVSTEEILEKRKAALAIRLDSIESNDPNAIKIVEEIAMIDSILDPSTTSLLPATMSSAPTSRGRTHAEWMSIVGREKDSDTLVEAITAMRELTNQSNAKESVDVLLKLLHGLKGPDEPLTESFLFFLYPSDNQAKIYQDTFQRPKKDVRTKAHAIRIALLVAIQYLSDEELDHVVSSADEIEKAGILVALASSTNKERTERLCKRLRDLSESDIVCGLANNILIEWLDVPPDEITRKALASRRSFVAFATGFPLLTDQRLPYPEEQGFGWGYLIGSRVEDRSRDLQVAVFGPAENLRNGTKLDEAEDRFIRQFTRGIVESWESEPAPAWGGSPILSFFQSFGVLDEDLRASAAKLLDAELERRLLERNRLAEQHPEGRSGAVIARIAQAHSILSGSASPFLKKHTPEPGSKAAAVAQQFAEQLLENPGGVDSDMIMWSQSYPFEMAQLQLGDSANSRVIDETRLWWLLLPLAAEGEKLKQHTISESLSTWTQPGRSVKEFLPPDPELYLRIAGEHEHPTTAAVALRIGQSMGLADEVVEPIALKLLEKAVSNEKGVLVADTDAYANALASLEGLKEIQVTKDQLAKFTESLSKPGSSAPLTRHAFAAAMRLHLRLDIEGPANHQLVQRALDESMYRGEGGFARREEPWTSISPSLGSEVIESALELVIKDPFAQKFEGRGLGFTLNETALGRLKLFKLKMQRRRSEQKYPIETQKLDRAIAALEKANQKWAREQAANTKAQNEEAADVGPQRGERTLEEKYTRYAERLISRFDANNDGQLTEPEWSKMLMSPKAADSNGDGAITLEEYATWTSIQQSKKQDASR